MVWAAIARALGQRKRPLAGYCAWVAVLVVVYYAVPAIRPETWGLLCLSGVSGIIAGLVLNRPARKLPWVLLAAALACFGAGQMSFLTAEQMQTVLPFPSFADALYLSCYPLAAAGLLGFVSARSPEGDRRALIDGLTLTAGIGLLSWMFLIRPYVHDPSLDAWQRAVTIAYPLGDVLVLALLVRLLATGTGGVRCVQFLTAGAVAVLASDSIYGAIQLYEPFKNGGPTDLGWALFYAAWGAAALHPTMARLTEPVPRQQATLSRVRLAVLMTAALIAPVVLLAARPTGSDVGVTAVFSAVLYLLVLARLWDAATSHRRARDRERVLRQAGLSLVTAADVAQVSTVVKDAAAALLGGSTQGDALLGVRVDGALHAVGYPGKSDGDLNRLAEAWQPLANAKAAVLTPMAGLPVPARGIRPVAEWMLLCPLTVSDTEDGEPVGLIAVFGEQRALADLTATLEILAHQAALTLQGVILRQEVIRQRGQAYFRVVVQDASDAIVIVTDEGVVRYATPSTEEIFGAVPEEGTTFWDIVADSDRDEFARAFRRLRQRSKYGSRTLEQHLTRRDGRGIYIQARCSDLRDDPSVAGLVLTLRDVTEQHALEEQLKHRAFHDALTGLPNRVLFQDRIAQQFAAGGRTGAIAGVLFIDLDDFKLVNDTMGHAAGDDLLVAVGERLSALTRETDTAARLGGDEFALLIANAADELSVEAAAERVIGAFSEPFLLADGFVTISATIGLATTLDSSDTSELLRHADLALYAAKAAGKRAWRRYRPVLSSGLALKRELKQALEEAAGRSEFTLAYQPIVRLATGELAGFEALLRWPHPQWGMLLPGQFISLAEETGHIIPIGAWVLRRASKDISQWRDDAMAGPDGLYVSVNVSARQFDDPAFADSVRRALDVSGLDPAALVLELTETTLLPRDGPQLAELARLRAIGIRLAIDDFGTGYSSLSYLRDLPVDLVKMDRSFVEGIEGNDRQLALAEGIVQIAANLDFQVVAEGIETETQLDLLKSMGCHYGQGYLLAMPMPPGQAGELARTGFTHPAHKAAGS